MTEYDVPFPMNPKRVASGGRITEPGEYVLTNDRRAQGVTPPSEAMIRIESDDVTLDGRGHAIVGNGVSDTTAITTAGRTLTDVTVRNLRVARWEIGVHFRNVEGATARDVEAEQNSYGLLFENVRGGDVEGCTVRENLIGVSLGPSVETFGAADSEIDGNHLQDVLRGTDGNG